MKSITTLLSILTLSLLLSGCGLLAPQKIPQVNKFTLSPNIKIKKARKTSRTILVTEPTTVPSLDTNKMAYTQNPWQVRYYSVNRWVAEPAKLIQPMLVDALSRTRHYRAVVAEPFAGNTSYRLDTQLTQLQRVFTSPSPMNSYVIINLRAELINPTQDKILASRIFSAKIPVNGSSPYAGVVASNQGLASILQNLAAWSVKFT